MGLAALASGTLLIAHVAGPYNLFAKHQYNCLMVDSLSNEAVLESISDGIDNSELVNALVAKARQTSLSYSHWAAADMYAKRLSSVRRRCRVDN